MCRYFQNPGEYTKLSAMRRSTSSDSPFSSSPSLPSLGPAKPRGIQSEQFGDLGIAHHAAAPMIVMQYVEFLAGPDEGLVISALEGAEF